jgi:hypothetical protein
MKKISKEIDPRYISEILCFLIEEREKIEETGYRLEHDHLLTWKYINKRIQKLNLLRFQYEFDEYLHQLDSALDTTKREV